MDKKSKEPIRTSHVASEGTKGELSSPFLMIQAVGERGEHIFENGGFLERESATSL